MYKEGVYSYAGLPRRRGESSKYSKSGFHSVRIMGYNNNNNNNNNEDYLYSAQSLKRL